MQDTVCTFVLKDIDSDKPMMQVGQYVFAGEYEDALGTCVLFEEEPHKGKADSGPELKYMCHTVKKLMMQRMFLTDKKESETQVTGGSCEGDEQRDSAGPSSQGKNTNQQRETEDEIENTDLEDSAVG
ncbi:general transcription factor 3C polypeptide 6 isoform X2 [Scomber japonicus]|uniref:general transcription factor 3C polypeptide 6 isoform X2 n=1 Tax=Scomber japonicus TaxID=13676 RepID=UPI0023051056|nr:general transcription factor 3C polypeptide 6 isoform X2 [Scomber japonicus]